MSACHDIENQMLDWLYGDLPAAESKALERHLEGCPSCAAQAKTLGATRQAFAALPLEEPPAAMTALLLHEAGKRAKKSDGLAAKFFAWLGPIAAHPGLAAAATLVVVVTVVGTVYVRQGKDVGNMNAAQPALEPAAPEQAPPAELKDVPAPSMAAAPKPATIENQADPQGARGTFGRAEPLDDVRGDLAPEETRQQLKKEKQKVAALEEGGSPYAGGKGLMVRDEKEIGYAEKNRSNAKEGLQSQAADGFAPPPPPAKSSPATSAPAGPAAEEAAADADDRELDKASEDRPPASKVEQKAVQKKDEDSGPSQVAQIQSALKFNRCPEAVRVADQLQKMYPQTYDATFGKSSTLESCRRQLAQRRKAADKPRPADEPGGVDTAKSKSKK